MLTGVLLIVLGVVGGIALIVFGATSATGTINRYQRVDARRGGVVTFAKAARYSAYFERPGIRRRSQLPAIRVILTGPAGTLTLDSDLARTNTSEHYLFGDHEGVRLTRFTIAQAGPYQVRTTMAGEPGLATPAQIAFGRGSITPGLLSVVGGVVGGGLLAFIGVIVLITSAVRRRRYRRRMTQGPYGGFGGGPGGPVGAWPAATAPPTPQGVPGQPPGWAPPPAPPATQQPGWPPMAPPSR